MQTERKGLKERKKEDEKERVNYTRAPIQSIHPQGCSSSKGRETEYI